MLSFLTVNVCRFGQKSRNLAKILLHLLGFGKNQKLLIVFVTYFLVILSHLEIANIIKGKTDLDWL